MAGDNKGSSGMAAAADGGGARPHKQKILQQCQQHGEQYAAALFKQVMDKLDDALFERGNKGGAGAEKTTVLVATLARDVLNEERPFQPFMDAVDMLSRFGGWEYGFFLYCVRRRAATLLQKLAPSSRTAEIKAAQAWAAELDSDGGGD